MSDTQMARASALAARVQSVVTEVPAVGLFRGAARSSLALSGPSSLLLVCMGSAVPMVLPPAWALFEQPSSGLLTPIGCL